MASFYNNTVRYFEFLKTVIGIKNEKDQIVKTPTEKKEEKKLINKNKKEEILNSAKFKISAEKFSNLDHKKLKYLIFCLEEFYSENGQFKAILSIADFHLRSNEFEKASDYLEKIIFDDSIDEFSKKMHNCIVGESRMLGL